MRSLIILLALSILATSCASYIYTHSADQTYPSKIENCKFKVVNTAPNPAEYVEIGSINSQDFYANAKNPEDWKSIIAKDVCAAGGDLVVSEINGYGQYIRLTVFVRKAS